MRRKVDPRQAVLGSLSLHGRMLLVHLLAVLGHGLWRRAKVLLDDDRVNFWQEGRKSCRIRHPVSPVGP
eukprot:477605-Prymnesium_polylepis.1